MKTSARVLAELLGGVFLVLAGLLLVFLFFCLYDVVDQWLLFFSLILFLLGLGAAAVVLGMRRIWITLRTGSHWLP